VQSGVLISGGTVVTMDPERRVIEDGAVLVRGDRIVAVGAREHVAAEAGTVDRIDATGGLVLPGLVNTHTHLFQTLLKGPGDDRPLYLWLRDMTAPAASALTEEDCEAAALHGAVEALRSGTTTIVDFMYPHPRPGLTDAVIRGLDAAGMRAIVGRGFVTQGTELGIPEAIVQTLDDALADVERLVREHGGGGPGGGEGLIRIGIAPCLLWMVDEAGLRATRAFADAYRTPIAYHMAETSFEVDYAQRTYGRRETEVLGDAGLLGPDLLAVHCTKLDDRDIDRLRSFDVKVSHNPVSNMYLASGVAPIPDMLRAGLTVGLATDGPASNNNQNMIHVLKYAALLHKVAAEDPLAMTAEKVLEMATIDGARAIGMDDEIGSLVVGKRADVTVMAFDNAHVTPVHDPISSIVYAALGTEARWVLVDGRIVLADARVTTVDEPAVRERVSRAALDLARRAGFDAPRGPWRGLSQAR
jgi:5-methylthioadenosine/S-adenosylhomocysteine deaminase